MRLYQSPKNWHKSGEFSRCGYWVSHIWGLIGYGITPHGAPWWQAIVEYDHNFWNYHQFGIFAKGLWGLGHHPLDPINFTGYGPIQHRSWDLGAKYTYIWDPGELTLEYAYRVWARNFPAQANTVMITLMIPFGI